MFGYTKHIILHAHIFKNGGTTLDWILRNNFGKYFVQDMDDAQMLSGPDHLEGLAVNNKGVKAISSHAMPTHIQALCKIPTLTLLMLRDPITRTRSCYDFERKQDALTPGAVNAKNMTFGEYIKWRMQPEVGATIRNFHIRFICRHLIQGTERLDDQHLLQAVQFVENNQLVGMVERFDDSLRVFKQALKPSFPRFNTRYEIQNTTSVKKQSREEKLQNIEQEIGEQLYQQLLEANRLDIKLYESASVIIGDRIARLKG